MSVDQPVLEPLHFISLHWTEERPYLQYRAHPAEPAIQYSELVADEPLAITVATSRICIGYYDFVQRQKFPCPDQRRLGAKYLQCFQCQRREVTYYTFTGQGADPEAAQTYLRTQGHASYLTLFGADLLKVGVASTGRRQRRTLEQGALASLFFAEADGNAIRVLERYISRELHVKERITTLQKIKRLAEQPTAEQAQATLQDKLLDVADNITPELKQYLLSQPDFYYHQPSYHLHLDAATVEVNFNKQVAGGDIYSGLVRGVVGNLLLLEAVDGRTYAVPMKQLQGYMLTVESDLKNMQLEHTPQVVKLQRSAMGKTAE